MWLNRVKDECQTFERYCSELSDYPILGSFVGAGRMLFGTIQAIVGLITMLISVIPALFDGEVCGERARDVLKEGSAHFAHGIGNIVTGALEAIPVVGTLTNALQRKYACLNMGYVVDGSQSFSEVGGCISL